MSATSDYIRQNFGDGDTLRDKGLSTPPDVERFDNIVYGPDPEWNVLDVYRRKRARMKFCRSSSASTAAAGSTAIRTDISFIAWSLAGGDLQS
jgi:hypothetical protein